MIGDDLVERIVDDALKGIRTPIKRGRGGYNFDLTLSIDTIIAGSILLVSLLQYIKTILPMTPRDTPGRTEEDLTEEDVVKMVVEYLKGKENMEAGMATKLARLILKEYRFSSDDR